MQKDTKTNKQTPKTAATYGTSAYVDISKLLLFGLDAILVLVEFFLHVLRIFYSLKIVSTLSTVTISRCQVVTSAAYEPEGPESTQAARLRRQWQVRRLAGCDDQYRYGLPGRLVSLHRLEHRQT